ncbi:MAG TPA: metallopeptidase TldD-related protein [Chloroflexota bacterium]|nr:metallopeptidase TldD-related protein [Chloroflexota bacterium]
MIDQIVSQLERTEGVDDWTLRRRRARSAQLYLIGHDVESVREVDTEEYEVEVFNDHAFPKDFRDRGGAPPQGLARGVTSIKLISADRGRLQQRVEDAVTMARLVHNPAFTLPEHGTYPDVPLADPLLATADSSRNALDAFADELAGYVAAEKGVRLSAAELFLTLAETELRNSRGVQVGASGTRILAELVLLTHGQSGGDEAEYFRQIEARRLSDLRLGEVVAESARYARDTLRAQAPRTRVGPVVLSGEALVTLFEAFTFHASARAAYMKLVSAEVGQGMLGDRALKGDALTIRSNALRPFALGAHRFDGDGVPGREVTLVEGGVLRQRLANSRYAQYLGIPVTGEAGTTEVEPGKTPLSELLRGPVLHVVKFSSPEIDPVTGDFGSEIRLAYEVDGESVTPVKGGSVSGNVFDAFAAARFSSSTTYQVAAGFSAGGGDYFGPEAVRFESLRVAGE